MSLKVYWDKSDEIITLYTPGSLIRPNPTFARHPQIVMPFGKYEFLRVRTCLVRDKDFRIGAIPKVSSSEDLYKMIKEMDILPAESLVVMLIDGGTMGCIGLQEVHVGGTAKAMLDIKQVLKASIIANADTLVVVHNHPHGAVDPSDTDALTAKKIGFACAAVDLVFLDFLIVGWNQYYSFRDHNRMP